MSITKMTIGNLRKVSESPNHFAFRLSLGQFGPLSADDLDVAPLCREVTRVPLSFSLVMAGTFRTLNGT